MGSHHEEIHFNLDIVKEEYSMNRENGSGFANDYTSDTTEDGQEFIEDDTQNDHQMLHFEITEIEQSGSQQKDGPEQLVCLICEQTFENFEHLKTHMHSHSNATEDSTFQCPYCPLVYGYKRFLDEHLQQNHAQENYPEENDTTFHRTRVEPVQKNDKGIVYMEIIRKGRTDVFRCRACSRIFKKKIHLRNHVTIHTSEKPYVCQVCGEAFRRKDYLNTHNTKHSNVSKTCPICKNEYSDLECLRRHLNKHLKYSTTTKKGDSSIICKVCSKTFNNQASFTIHMRKWHPDHPEDEKKKITPRVAIKREKTVQSSSSKKPLKILSKNAFKCIPCNQMFKSKKILTKHGRTKRHLQALEEQTLVSQPEPLVEKFQYACENCGSSFSNRKLYMAHRQTHKDRPRKYECPQCPLKFKRKMHLEDHLLTHDPNRPIYTCDCGKEYKSKKSLVTRHFKVCAYKRVHKSVNGFLIKTEKID